MNGELTVEEAADEVGVTIQTVRAWVRAGKFKVRRDGTKPGQPYFIVREDFERFIRAKQGLE